MQALFGFILFCAVFSFIEILKKHKPKVQWDDQGKEHFIHYKYVSACHAVCIVHLYMRWLIHVSLMQFYLYCKMLTCMPTSVATILLKVYHDNILLSRDAS